MLTYEEFKDEIVRNIKTFLPEEYSDADISIQSVTKNNDTVLDGVIIRNSDRNIVPNIYLNGYYDQYQNGEKDLGAIMTSISEVRVQHEMDRDFDLSFLSSIDTVRDRITCKLINAEHNADYLSDKPHTVVQNLAMVYYVEVESSLDGQMNAPITNALMEQYGLDTAELNEIALGNFKDREPEFKTISEILMELLHITPDDPMAEMMLPPADAPAMYVLTNADKINGAAQIMNPAAMDMISDRLKGDFIILPSSIHEVIILPNARDAVVDMERFESIIRGVNAEKVAPEERLSDNAYVYDSVEKSIVLMSAYAERTQTKEYIVEPEPGWYEGMDKDESLEEDIKGYNSNSLIDALNDKISEASAHISDAPAHNDRDLAI